MNRRHFLSGATAAFAAASTLPAGATSESLATELDLCGCNPFIGQNARRPDNVDLFSDVNTNLRVTDMKVFGVSLTPDSDRPYVFVKIETNQGVVGWGEATLEGKAGAAMSCVQDFRDLIVGKDPMQVEHHWQSMYVHSFYRAGPVIGSAISGIDQARSGTFAARCWAYPSTSFSAGHTMSAVSVATTTPRMQEQTKTSQS